MANWIILMDHDDERRRAFVNAIEPHICPIDDLLVDQLEGRGWSSLWAAGKHAFVDARKSGDGAAMIWGEARDDVGDIQPAEAIAAGWRDGTKTQWDGYYAAADIDADSQSMTIGCDALGLFPIHYWTNNKDVCLVASSPELFRYHPAFEPRFNMKGLVGILLTHGQVSGEGLWKDVTRLTPGKRLRIRDFKAEEIHGFDLSEPAVSGSLPFSAQVDRLYDALTQSVAKLKDDNQTYTLLLSGGLDSRMVQAFLAENGIEPHAITQGLAADLEAHCASAVAKAYNLRHEIIEPDKANYPGVASLMARWEHVGTGFTNIREWWTQGELAKRGTRVATGLLADSLLGGTCHSWAYSDEDGTISREHFLSQMPNLGIAEEILRKLLEKPGHAHLVDQCQEELKDEFYAFSDSIANCAWRYDLAHGQRYHVGGVAWRLSFGSWPVIPLLDQNLLRVVASMPSSCMADRELQLGLVRDKFPDMARLPLDRSDLLDTYPQYITAEGRELLDQNLWKARMLMRKMLGPLQRNTEYRYWHRVNNFQGELWREVRADVEPFKRNVEHLFDAEFLNTLVPDPSIKYPPPAPWVSEAGRKMLMGLVYWSKEHDCSI
ncbi:MAG: asparagine synthase-related protein [Pseudomonadota bacterium]